MSNLEIDDVRECLERVNAVLQVLKEPLRTIEQLREGQFDANKMFDRIQQVSRRLHLKVTAYRTCFFKDLHDVKEQDQFTREQLRQSYETNLSTVRLHIQEYLVEREVAPEPAGSGSDLRHPNVEDDNDDEDAILTGSLPVRKCLAAPFVGPEGHSSSSVVAFNETRIQAENGLAEAVQDRSLANGELLDAAAERERLQTRLDAVEQMYARLKEEQGQKSHSLAASKERLLAAETERDRIQKGLTDALAAVHTYKSELAVRIKQRDEAQQALEQSRARVDELERACLVQKESEAQLADEVTNLRAAASEHNDHITDRETEIVNLKRAVVDDTDLTALIDALRTGNNTQPPLISSLV
jgi:hypothetical protein